MTRSLPKQKSSAYLLLVLACLAASAGAAYDANWSRSDCAAYSYNGLNERYVYGGNKGWIDNDKWDSSSVEGVDCASYVCRALALPSYVAENKSATYPYTTSKLYAGVPHLVRIHNVADLQPWDIWVWRVEYGGPSTGHTGFVKEITSSSIVTREALSANSGVVERTRRKQDLVDWGCRFYRRDNWAAGTTVTVPSAQTNTAGSITQTSATLKGAVVSDGGASIDSRGFAWGTSSACDDGWIDGTTSTTFSGKLSGLNPDSRYYFKAMAHNSKGWGSGQVRSFVTGAIVSDGSEIIVDNGSSGTSSTGTWGVSGGTGSYGSNSLWARDGATYTWRFTPPSAGTYEVHMWWTEFSSRSAAVPVAISHAGGTASQTVNQQTDGGQWNLLGTYTFDRTGSVKLTATGSYPTSNCADAVKFVPVKSDNQSPVATIDSITPSSAQAGQEVTMVGHGIDNGSVTAYQWSSSLDGVLGSTATLITSGLSVGTHTISFKVCDNEGAWSKADVDTVTITESPSLDEIIIDNGGAGTSYTGTWQVSGGANPYGSNSLYGRDGGTYSWGTTALIPGTYEVLMRWTEISSRSSSAPIRIQHADGTTDTTVNQRTGGGQWNSLGVYTFNGSGKVTLTAPDGYPTSYCADAVWFVKADDSGEDVVEEVTLDNGDAGTSYTGTWSVSGGANSYGSNSLYGRDGASYTWGTTALTPGTYEVSMWWTAFSSRSTRVPIRIQHADGTTDVTVNQQTGGGQWNSLGVYTINGSGSVTLNAPGRYPNSYCADAVRFVKVDAAREEITMDNGVAGTYYSGTWGVSGGTGAYGSNSLWARETARYKWTYTPQNGGRYEVSLWWTEFSSRGTKIPVTLTYRGGNEKLTVNQQDNGGQWNVLGTYPMTAGTTYSVLVETAGDGSTACADAIRVRRVSD